MSAQAGGSPSPSHSDDELKRVVYGTQKAPSATRTTPNFPYLHAERKRPGVTLALLHVEYLEKCPDGYRYYSVPSTLVGGIPVAVVRAPYVVVLSGATKSEPRHVPGRAPTAATGHGKGAPLLSAFDDGLQVGARGGVVHAAPTIAWHGVSGVGERGEKSRSARRVRHRRIECPCWLGQR